MSPPIKESVTPSKTPKSRIVAPCCLASTPVTPAAPITAAAPITPAQAVPQAVASAQPQNNATNTITVGPDQQQVFYTVSGEDGKTQQYMMLCPKDMDQNTLITTLVRQISADPSNKGKKTIRITQHKSTPSAEPQQPQVHSAPAKTQAPVKRGRVSAASTPKTSRKVMPQEILPDTKPPKELTNIAKELTNIVDSSENFESVVPELAEQVQNQAVAQVAQQQAETVAQGQQALAAGQAGQEEVRVYVRCNYCDCFRYGNLNFRAKIVAVSVIKIYTCKSIDEIN